MTRGTSSLTGLIEASRLAQLYSPKTHQQLQMVKNGIHHLAQPSIGDWRYNWPHISSLFSWLSAGELEALQQFNPTVGFVSTPIDGIGAGFTETGRLCSLSFPHTGFTHQVPFYISGDDPGLGKPLEGGFGGIESDGTRMWFWDGVEHDIEYREHSAILDITMACDEFHITESAYVYPGSETLVRDFTIQNTSSKRQNGTFIYHTRANVNDNNQTFALWNSNWNRLDGGTDLCWDDREGPYELQIWCDAENSRTEIDGMITLQNAAFGKYLDGQLLVDFSIPAGETKEISVCTTGGIDGTAQGTAIESDRAERQAAVESWWDEWVDDLVCGDVPDEFIDLYIRSAIILGMLVDPQSGSLSASPNLQPMYYPSWVRDNAFGAIALAKMGKPELATELLADFCPSIQEDDGSFRQCYNSRGEFTGIIPVEHDQQPLFAWAVREVYQETGDERFLNRAWPAVKRALDYTVDVIDENGLLAPTPDIAEYPGDVQQSLWTNAFAYRGLLDGAMVAEQRGVDDEPYRCAAQTIGDAIERELFDIELVDQGESDSPRIRMNGGQVVLYDACAIHPTEWASEYDRENQLLVELSQRIKAEWSDWIPGSLLTAAMLYSRGEQEQGDILVAEMARETTATGYLAETRTRDGTHYFASPLAWSHAAFIYALSEMYL